MLIVELVHYKQRQFCRKSSQKMKVVVLLEAVTEVDVNKPAVFVIAAHKQMFSPGCFICQRSLSLTYQRS